MLKIRIVTVDYYLTTPIRNLDPTYCFFRSNIVKQVPVIRVFGITEEGKKICVHIHGVLPYIFIPLTNENNPDGFMYEIANGLEEAINKVFNTPKKQHIFKITVVSGKPFYGYHSQEHQFLKIYFYNPAIIKKAITLLEEGAVCGQKLQPHEAHIPFILQFFIDYNLHGMSFLNLSKWIQRLETPEGGSQEVTGNSKVSYCELEGDALEEDVLNKSNEAGGTTLNPGLANIWAEEMKRRRLEGKDSEPTIIESQERTIIPTKSDLKYREQLLSSLMENLGNIELEDTPGHPVLTPPNATFHEASLQENHSGTDKIGNKHDILDDADMSLIEVIKELMSRNDNEQYTERVEEDSILGSQILPEEEPDTDDDLDLTQPLDSLIATESDEEVDISDQMRCGHVDSGDENANSPWAESFWATVHNLSQIEKNCCENTSEERNSPILPSPTNNPPYVDGTIDETDSNSDETPEKKTPEKAFKKSSPNKKTPTKRRYEPLKISIQKSPLSKKFKSDERGNPSEIDLMKQFQKNSAQISQAITSPKSAKSVSCIKVPDKEKDSKIKRKIYSDKKTSRKKNDPSKNLYKSLRIRLLKRSNSFDDQGGTVKEDLQNDEIYDRTEKEMEEIPVKESLIIPEAGKSEVKARKVLFPQHQTSCHDTSSESLNESIIEISPSKSNETGHEQSFAYNSDKLSSSDGVLSFYESFTEIDKTHVSSKDVHSKCYEPLKVPPSKVEMLQNIKSLGLNPINNSQPFYGDPNDVPTSKEVGCEVVKLSNYFPPSLDNFEGSFQNSLHVARFNLFGDIFNSSNKLNCKTKQVSEALTTKRPVIITPVRSSPTRECAEKWLRNEKSKKHSNKPVIKRAKKILIPQSPDGSDEECLALTPCTPGNDSQIDLIHSTPDFQNLSIPSPAVTPISNTSAGNCKRKRISDNFSKRDKLESIQEVDENDSSASTLKGSDNTSKSGMDTQLDIKSNSCTIDCATPENSGIFKMELQNLQEAYSGIEHKYLTVFGMEIHVATRGDLKPDPEHDAICAAFYTITNDVPESSHLPSQLTGIIMNCAEYDISEKYLIDCPITKVSTEVELINELINLIRKWDPDILAGYEIEMLSWGYLMERGFKIGMNLVNSLSRLLVQTEFHPENFDSYKHYDLKLIGRIILNVWRLMRHEVSLMSYSFENIMYHVLHTRVSKFSFRTLTHWWSHPLPLYRERLLEYYVLRVKGIMKILEQLDFIGRTSELASLFGIQFYEVLSRGSQFRVESMMLRMAKPMNFVAVSPSIKQRASMRAPECLPLIMEPMSRFYADPVIVLDFQSLYPSMMIAYNLCFSTCLGRVQHLIKSEKFEFGCTELKVSYKELMKIKNDIHVSPVGIAFVGTNVRKGILPQMLEEILNTRLMVKKSLKEHKNNKILRRVLNARQLGLKLIANVTYGYTSANFSGRMASVEVADSVVSKGRETLERAIDLVNKTEKWGARVIYGDTDSLFVLCPGKNRKEAFEIGQEIADAVTQSNPKPVKLKLEKVYQPCILQTKKRYVGYMYESPDQEQAEYDAKGIETVRRDGCPAVSKILEKSLKILFETKDVSKVKGYVCRQIVKLISGRLSLQELIFAREYRGINGYRPGACVPALKLAREWMAKDKRAEPRVSERVGYVVAYGPPGFPLIKLVHSPFEMLSNESLKINAEYYILKVILPPLDRCLSLLGANVLSWYTSLPKKQLNQYRDNTIGTKKATISQYFATVNCLICNVWSNLEICINCQKNPQILSSELGDKINKLERKAALIRKICESCCGRTYEIPCVSLDCPVLFRRTQLEKDVKHTNYIREIQKQFLPDLF